MIEPDEMLNNGHGEAAKRRQRRCSGQDAVAVRLGVGHGGSAYPRPVKATQPSQVLAGFRTSPPGIEPAQATGPMKKLLTDGDTGHQTLSVVPKMGGAAVLVQTP